MRRQAGVLYAGDERTEIESARGLGRCGKTTRRLSLRRVELELAPVEANEERVLVRYTVIDTSRERILSDIPIDGRSVVVEITRAVRKWIDARHVSTDCVDPVRRNGVAGKWITEELWIGAADRPGGI